MPNAQRGGSNGPSGAMRGIRDQVERTEGSIREGVERAGQRMREGCAGAGEAVSHGYRRAQGLVGRHPTPSLLIGFSLGLGLGMLLTLAVARPEEPWWRRDWRLPDSLRHLQDRLTHHA
jgi:hypothetical protein